MSDNKVFTTTPDAANGNAIAVVQVTNAASQVVDQQVVTLGDPTDGTLHASITASGLAVQTGPVVVSGTVAVSAIQSTSPWVISGAVTVSGPVTVANAVTIAGTANGVLATGTAVIGALMANQSVTIAATANVLLATGAAVVGAVTQSAGPWTINVQQIGGVAVTAVGVSVQGVSAHPTQDLKDSGRSYRTFTIVSVTGITAEALVTMNINSSGTVTTSTTYTVTSGKRLRLQAGHLSVVNQSATAVGFASRMTVRVAATVTVASAALLHLQTGVPGITAASVNNGGGPGVSLQIPDGLEIPASQQLGISHLETGITGEITGVLIGYEY